MVKCSACPYQGRTLESLVNHVWAAGCLAGLNADQKAEVEEAFALWVAGNAADNAAKPHRCLVDGCSFRAKTPEALQAHAESPAHVSAGDGPADDCFLCPRCPDKRWWRLEGKGGFANHAEACRAAAEWDGPADPFTCPRCPDKRWWYLEGRGGFANHAESCEATAEWEAEETASAPPPPQMAEIITAARLPPLLPLAATAALLPPFLLPAATYPRLGVPCGSNRKAHARGRCLYCMD